MYFYITFSVCFYFNHRKKRSHLWFSLPFWVGGFLEPAFGLFLYRFHFLCILNLLLLNNFALVASAVVLMLVTGSPVLSSKKIIVGETPLPSPEVASKMCSFDNLLFLSFYLVNIQIHIWDMNAHISSTPNRLSKTTCFHLTTKLQAIISEPADGLPYWLGAFVFIE